MHSNNTLFDAKPYIISAVITTTTPIKAFTKFKLCVAWFPVFTRWLDSTTLLYVYVMCATDFFFEFVISLKLRSTEMYKMNRKTMKRNIDKRTYRRIDTPNKIEMINTFNRNHWQIINGMCNQIYFPVRKAIDMDAGFSFDQIVSRKKIEYSVVTRIKNTKWFRNYFCFWCKRWRSFILLYICFHFGSFSTLQYYKSVRKRLRLM